MFSTSVFVMQTLGRLQLRLNYLRSECLVALPKMDSSCSKALLVQTTKRPRWPPGASFRMLSEFTLQKSRPGKFLNARNFSASPLCTNRGPRFCLKRLFLYFPMPARIFLEDLDALMSSLTPSLVNSSTPFLVFSTLTSTSTTKGSSASRLTRWPRPWTKAVRAEAETVDAMAYLLLFKLVFRVHLLQTRLGFYMCPPRQEFAKAPEPEAWVPPPLILGTLATARPGPHDSAE
mmetsp:Transcript_57705/g.125504  ORF Transcript_57705/g.125504 Transcript_57705/m.125504 type:complete len:233 (+) Transcript_57705:365-1063(+)